MIRTILLAVLIIIVITVGPAWPNENQPHASPEQQRIDEFNARNEEILDAFGEPGFCTEGLEKGVLEQYRIIWDRAFHPPMFVTFTITQQGRVYSEAVNLDCDPRSCDVMKKQTTWVDVCGFEARRFEEEVQEFCSDRVGVILEQAKTVFWSQPTDKNPDLIMLDGSYWEVEGRRVDQCHAVVRPSPDFNSDFFEFFFGAVTAADQQFLFGEVY